jgi:hypothetical protein
MKQHKASCKLRFLLPSLEPGVTLSGETWPYWWQRSVSYWIFEGSVGTWRLAIERWLLLYMREALQDVHFSLAQNVRGRV